VLAWIKSFLSNRVQTVVINGTHSYPTNVKSGVPQGTVLGPILFLVYINDLHQCINHSIISHFADDTRILKAIGLSSDVPLLQQDLNETISWSNKNKMVLRV
jgi:ribonuclease P/MRP protein subunit RPP40